MKNYFLLSFILSMHTFLLQGNIQDDLVSMYIDFDESVFMAFSGQEFEWMLAQKPQKQYLPLLKKLYEQSNFLTKLYQPTLNPGIPRIIHQIWLGSPLPERYKKFQESWKKFHPDWEYRLWTDADVKDFKLINQIAYDQSKNYAEKANVFRYEILDRLGGLYVDTDFECFRSFDMLNQFYEFYTGMATINRVTLINNGLIASIPGHPILKACINNINKKNLGFGQMGKNGTIYFGQMVVESCENNSTLDLTKIMILPPTYLYPWPGVGAHKSLQEYILPTSFAVHYWDGTWTPYSEFSVAPSAKKRKIILSQKRAKLDLNS